MSAREEVIRQTAGILSGSESTRFADGFFLESMAMEIQNRCTDHGV